MQVLGAILLVLSIQEGLQSALITRKISMSNNQDTKTTIELDTSQTIESKQRSTSEVIESTSIDQVKSIETTSIDQFNSIKLTSADQVNSIKLTSIDQVKSIESMMSLEPSSISASTVKTSSMDSTSVRSDLIETSIKPPLIESTLIQASIQTTSIKPSLNKNSSESIETISEVKKEVQLISSSHEHSSNSGISSTADPSSTATYSIHKRVRMLKSSAVKLSIQGLFLALLLIQ